VKSTSGLLAYIRKSSKEDPAISRERQRRAIDGWAKAAGVAIVGEVYEPGVSGSKPWQERGLGQAIEACKRGEAAGIIVEEASRLSRQNLAKTAEVWEAFEQAGLRLVCVVDGIDTANGDHELNFGMRALLAREQWKQYARRVEDAKRNAVARGVHISAKVPAGYVRRARGLPLELDRKTAPAIRRAFELRAGGASRPAVAALLEELLPGGPRGRGRWTVETVGSLLRNRVYLGEARQGKHVLPDAHPALVDRATFDTVQALWARPEPRSAPSSTVALLAGGIARCGSCGYALVRSSSGSGRGVVYKCRGHSASGLCPARASVSAAALDEYVEAAVLERIRSQRIERAPATVDVDALHRRLAGLREQRAMFEEGEFAVQLGPEAALRGLRGVDEKIVEVELELADAVPASDSPFELLTVGEKWPESVAKRREIIAAGVDAVIVSRALRGSAVADRVEILWRGEAPPAPRPSRGGPEVEPGLVAAEDRA
jgi:DNA invertase Pin-like site-specific DNA recombinase